MSDFGAIVTARIPVDQLEALSNENAIKLIEIGTPVRKKLAAARTGANVDKVQAVDYDVFVCDSCKNETIYTYDKPSAYTNCPKCNTKAFILKSKKTIIAPTHLSSGTERVTYHCKFCGYEENHNNNLPRLQNNNDGAFVKGVVIGSILNSGRGGFGGGGGFSGGSFGGGSSGGGGATSGW